MAKKLLNNKNNLIIIITIICAVLLTIPTVVLAETGKTLSQYMKETVAMWYVYVRSLCIAVMLIGLIIVGIKSALSTIAEERAKFKKLLLTWIIGFAILLTIDKVMYAVIYLEQSIVSKLAEFGRNISQGDSALTDASQEITLYESAKSKAYEIKFTSGMLGLFMYMVLVWATFKFFIIYAKRYINVILLILVAPIIITIYSFRKIINGKGGMVKRWVKEFIYNVFIQVVHAATYSVFVGYALRLSDNVLSFIGAFLTFIAFLVMFKIDGIIRKIFNFVGGKSVYEYRDYTEAIKYPKATVEYAQQYFGQTLPNAARDKLGEIQQNLSNVTPKSLASGIANKADKTLALMNAENVKVSKKQIEEEQKKLSNPNAVQRALVAVGRGVRGSAELMVGGIENISDAANKINKAVKEVRKNVKKEIVNIKNAIKKGRKELNQDIEFLKRFKRVLKYNYNYGNYTKKVRQRRKAAAKGEDALPIPLKAAVTENLEPPEKQVLEFKKYIEENKVDIAAIIYAVNGPAAFIYAEQGSSYMGMSILASSRIEERALRAETQESSEEKSSKIIRFPNRQRMRINLANSMESETSINKERYHFKRFNHSSIKTITHSLNRRYIMNSEYLSSLYQAGKMIVNGNVTVTGVAGDVEVRRTSIKYRARLESSEEHSATADVTFGRYTPSDVREAKLDKDQVVSFKKSIKQKKLRAQRELQTYQARVQDSNWAVLEGTAEDVKAVQTRKVESRVQSIRQKTSSEVQLDHLVDVGQAVKVSDGTYITFGSQVGSNEKAPAIDQIQILESGRGFVKREDVSIQTIQEITSSSIIDVAVDMDVPLEDIDFDENKEAQDKIIETLIEKGVVVASAKTDEEEREEVTKALESIKKDILKNQKEQYVKSVVQRTAAKIVKQKIQFGVEAETFKPVGDGNFDANANADKLVKSIDMELNRPSLDGDEVVRKARRKAKDIENQKQREAAKSNRFTGQANNDSFGNLLNQIAANAVKAEAEQTKQELLRKVQFAVDTTKRYVDDAEKVYGVTLDDFKAKGNQVKESAKEIPGAAIEAAGNVAAATVRSMFGGAKHEKENKDKYDKEDMFVFFILGAVVAEGRYELKIGSRIYDAIKVAGGLTEEADLTAIPFDEPIRDGETIYIPTRNDDKTEELLEAIKPVVNKVIQEYLVENNISNVETLRKTVHKKTLVSKIQKELEREGIPDVQIEGLIEKRIKELKFIRKSLNQATEDMKVVDKAEKEVKETKQIKAERARQENGARNSEEASLDDALKRLHAMSNYGTEETEAPEVEEDSEENSQNVLLNDLLGQLENQKEKVLVGANRSSENNRRLKRLEFDGSQGAQSARDYYTEDPDKMMNKILGRI